MTQDGQYRDSSWRRAIDLTRPVALLVSAIWLSAAVALGAAPKFASDGVVLTGSQFLYDSGFDVFDWNDDGRADFVLANNSITRFITYRTQGDPEKPELGHGYSYPYNLTETMPKTVEHAQSYAWCDLNSDGLRDIIVYDGQLRMIYNTGTATAPNHWHLAKEKNFFPGSEQMVKDNDRYVTGPESMYWNRGIFPRLVLTLTVNDWDHDGLDDLLVCRFRDQAPGVVSSMGQEDWTILGRISVYRRTDNPVPPKTPEFLRPLAAAPARGTYFYKNTGTKEKPFFDKGIELKTPTGEPVIAPNLQAVDLDGDGSQDLIATETAHAVNCFRVDWPTANSVQWFRRPDKSKVDVLEPAKPVCNARGASIPAGIMARVADFRGNGKLDLFVQDAQGVGTIRWYRNAAEPGKPVAFGPVEVLRGKDFCRFNIMQPQIVDWFGPGSQDLILHGGTDAHCKWSLRRTGLYRNVAKKPGEVAYSFVGWLNFNGDPRMVSPEEEDRPYDSYGTTIALAPDVGDGKKRLVMSVSGKCYWFSDLAADGLTFQKCQALNLPAERNRRRGWQDIPVASKEKVRYIRLNNDRNGMHGWRDHYLNIEKFEAISGGKNVSTIEAGATVGRAEPPQQPDYHVDRPEIMISSEPPKQGLPFTSVGYANGPAVVTLKEAVPLEKIRFLLSDKDTFWYSQHLPFFWQGELYRARTESKDIYYQYTVEVSADNTNWTKVADTMWTEMARSAPCLLDWNGDGKLDLVLCAMHTKGIYPQKRDFRLYLNKGDNNHPKFDTHVPLCNAAGEPLIDEVEWAQLYSLQAGIAVRDFDGDGKRDLLVEGVKDGSLDFWRNVSQDSAAPRFEFVKELGDPSPIRRRADQRYFCLGDVDKDGVVDWVETHGEVVAWFKGTAADAPSVIADLAVDAIKLDTAQLHWTRPEGASRYQVGWSTNLITEANWVDVNHQTGDYATGSAADSLVEQKLGGLPQGKTVFIRVRSFNQKAESSPLSNEVQIVTAPNRQLVLRNGPAAGVDTPAYTGSHVTYVHSKSPQEPAKRKGNTVAVNAPGTDGHRVVLVRFDNLPQLGGLERATLELTLPPEEYFQLPGYCDVSCFKFRPDWDPAQATYAAAAPGKPWAPEELIGGDKFLSRTPQDPILTRTPVLRWDVSDAVRSAAKSGAGTVSLLVRVDDTGHYVSGKGYTFCDAEHPAVNLRPRLRVITH